MGHISKPNAAAKSRIDVELEAIAKDIKSTQAKAILHVAERLTEARELFRYRRDEGGFGGWVENRLHLSRQTAYNLLNVHKQFGGQSVKTLGTFAPSILYLLAAPSTPDEAREAVIARAETGEPVTVADVEQTIATTKGRKARGRKPKSVSEPESEQQIDLEDAIASATAETSTAARKAAYAAEEQQPDVVETIDGHAMTPRNQILRETLAALKAAGFEPRGVQSRHFKVSWIDSHGQRRHVIVSRSPSARNAINNNRAVLRRLLVTDSNSHHKP